MADTAPVPRRGPIRVAVTRRRRAPRRRSGLAGAGPPRHLTALVAVALLAVTVTACGGGRRHAVAAMPEEAFANASAYGSDEQAQFSGVVTDTAGAPLAGVGVAMCGSACWPAWTDESGRFVYDSLPVERYALDVRGESVAGRTLTSVVLPVTLTAGSQTLGTPLRLHEAESVAEWRGNSPVRFAGISLTPTGPVDVAALARAAGAGSATIGGAQVPREAWPEYPLADGEARYRPLAMWALHPFGVPVGGPLTVRVARPAHTAGRDADLAFFSVDPLTGAAHWLGPAIAEQDALRTGPDRGITTLTWIILAERGS